jgi:toxin-antitoxin system PIN domain toxin
VIAVDTNILVYSHREEEGQYDEARSALESIWSTGRGWGLPWPCVHEFLAVVTNRKVYPDPTPMAVAIDAVHSFIEVGARLLGESTAHLEIIDRLVMAGRVTGPKVHDARVAAICIGQGVEELWTVDRDFSYFPELRTRNPLVGQAQPRRPAQ